MPSSVVASKNGYILIAPFTSKGAVIDFSSYKDISIEIGPPTGIADINIIQLPM